MVAQQKTKKEGIAMSSEIKKGEAFIDAYNFATVLIKAKLVWVKGKGFIAQLVKEFAGYEYSAVVLTENRYGVLPVDYARIRFKAQVRRWKKSYQRYL